MRFIRTRTKYAASNARFALAIDPENPALQKRADEINLKVKEGTPTVPVRLDLEQATNPFLRASDPDLKAKLGLSDQQDAQVFAEIRRRKDSF